MSLRGGRRGGQAVRGADGGDGRERAAGGERRGPERAVAGDAVPRVPVGGPGGLVFRQGDDPLAETSDTASLVRTARAGNSPTVEA